MKSRQRWGLGPPRNIPDAKAQQAIEAAAISAVAGHS